jgi:hypothetical protein
VKYRQELGPIRFDFSIRSRANTPISDKHRTQTRDWYSADQQAVQGTLGIQANFYPLNCPVSGPGVRVENGLDSCSITVRTLCSVVYPVLYSNTH